MDDALVLNCIKKRLDYENIVLILVVMDDALVPILLAIFSVSVSLNPCCNG